MLMEPGSGLLFHYFIHIFFFILLITITISICQTTTMTGSNSLLASSYEVVGLLRRVSPRKSYSSIHRLFNICQDANCLLLFAVVLLENVNG